MESAEPVRPQLTPESFRQERNGVGAARMTHGDVKVSLLRDPRRARVTHEFTIEVDADAEAEDWKLDVPWPANLITNFSARDDHENLRSAIEANGRTARIHVWFSRPISSGTPYRFTYQYDQPITAVVAAGSFTQTVTFAGWFVFDLACRDLNLSVQLPERCTMIEAVPAAMIEQPKQPLARYELHDLRPLETTTCAVGYKKFRLGASFYFWTVGAVGSGLIGWAITRMLGGG